MGLQRGKTTPSRVDVSPQMVSCMFCLMLFDLVRVCGGTYRHGWILHACIVAARFHTLCMRNSQHVGGSFEAAPACTQSRCAAVPQRFDVCASPFRLHDRNPPHHYPSCPVMADNRIVTTAGQRRRRALEHRCSLMTDAGFHHPRDGSEVSLGATFSLHLQLGYPAVQITSSGYDDSAGLSGLFNLHSEALEQAQGSFMARLNAVDLFCGRTPRKRGSWLNSIHIL